MVHLKFTKLKSSVTVFLIVFLLLSFLVSFRFTVPVEASTSDVFTDGFDVSWNKWDGNGATTWINGTDQYVSSPNAAKCGSSNDGYLISDDIDMRGATEIGISFKIRDHLLDNGDGYWYMYDGAAYDQIADLNSITTSENTWKIYTYVTADSQYFKSNFRIRFYETPETNEICWVDDVLVNKTFETPKGGSSITRVQGNARGTSTTNSITVTMVSTPTSGNVLVAVIGTGVSSGSPVTVSSITETNVVWTKQVNYAYASQWDVEIWLGVVSASASKTVTVALSGNANYAAVADICEYSGVATSSFLDVTATNTGTTNPDTGTTANTAQNDELWIGGTNLYYYTQSTPTNGFTLFDGATTGGSGVAYLEKIVSATGTANSGTKPSTSGQRWVGCIATFKAAAAQGQNLAFTSFDNVNVASYNQILKELAFQSTGSIRLFDLGQMLKALPFQLTNTVHLYDQTTILRALGFQTSNTINPYSFGTLMKELAFQASNIVKPYDYGTMLKASGFQATSSIYPYDFTTMLKAKVFLSSNSVNLYSTILRSIEMESRFSEMVKPFGNLLQLKALGFQSSDTIKVFDVGTMLMAKGFLTDATLNVYSAILRGIELGFAPTGILYLHGSGTSGKETATILVDRFELARLFDNAEMLKALGFRTTVSLNLFDSSAMSKAIGLLTSGTINVYSSILKGLGLAFQPTGVTKVWDVSSMLKALGFQVNGAVSIYDSTTMLKALGFSITDALKIVDSLSGSFEIYQYIPQNFYFTLTDIVKMFSGISFNMAKGFSNYNVIHPSGSLIQNKALQFGIDGLVRLFSQTSIGIAKAFSNFAILNPYSYLNMSKALGFKAYELPLFFDYLGMGKSIRITTFEFLNTELIRFSGTLTMGKSILIAFAENLFDNLNIQSIMIPIGQIVIVPGIPASSFWKILAMFSIVMLMVSGVFLIEKQKKSRQSQRDE